MPLEATTEPPASAPQSPHTRRLRIADVALFYGERGGGIRTYLEAKAAYAARTGAFEHHLVVPGKADAGHTGSTRNANRHVQPSLQLAASNGYRVPLGGSGLHATLRALRPDVVLLHDPYWTPRLASRAAHEVGAVVIAVSIYLSYRFAERIGAALGDAAMNVIIRLSSFILVCIGVQISWNGLSALLRSVLTP